LCILKARLLLPPHGYIQRGKGGTHNVTACLSWPGLQRGVGAKTTSLLALAQINPGSYCDGGPSGDDVLATAGIFTTPHAN